MTLPRARARLAAWLAALVVFAAVAALVVAQWRSSGVISAPGGRRNSS